MIDEETAVGGVLRHLDVGPSPRPGLGDEIWQRVAPELRRRRSPGLTALAAVAAAIFLLASAVALNTEPAADRVTTGPATSGGGDGGAGDRAGSPEEIAPVSSTPVTTAPARRSVRPANGGRTTASVPSAPTTSAPPPAPGAPATTAPVVGAVSPPPAHADQWVAFSREATDGSTTVWVTRLDGTAARQVSTGSSPSWSPDGSSLALVDAGALYVVDVERGARRQVAHGAGYANHPSWSPDGRWIAVHAGVGGHDVAGCAVGDPCRSVLRLVAPDGSEVRELGSGAAANWAPDGRKLVFVELDIGQRCDRGDCHGSLWTMRADGSERINQGRDGAQPSFAPDGKRVVYQQYVATDTQVITVFTVGEAGSTRVSRGTPRNDWTPTWTPDSEIVYARAHSTGSLLRLVAADGSNPRDLTPMAAAFDLYPDVVRRPGR